MFIPAITPNLNNRSKSKTVRENRQPTFKAHPDLRKLQLANDDFNASRFFRRGPYYASQNINFQEVVDVFSEIFLAKSRRPKKMFIAGIADSQEPFSYLATIKEIIGKKTLDKAVDLSIVDLQSRPSSTKLFTDSFFDGGDKPRFAVTSFVEDLEREGSPKTFRVKDDIFDFLSKIYNDKNRSRWDTRVQDAVKDYPSNHFDVVSINNTLGYIDNIPERSETLQNVHRILKKDGAFITDPVIFTDLINAGIIDKLHCIGNGIFKKL